MSITIKYIPTLMEPTSLTPIVGGIAITEWVDENDEFYYNPVFVCEDEREPEWDCYE